jgi:hypothetical protein
MGSSEKIRVTTASTRTQAPLTTSELTFARANEASWDLQTSFGTADYPRRCYCQY